MIVLLCAGIVFSVATYSYPDIPSLFRPTRTLPPYRPSPLPPTAKPRILGILEVNGWRFELHEVHADPGLSATSQNVVMIGSLTNNGMRTETFTSVGIFLLQDGYGRQYEEDFSATSAAERRYGTQIPSRISPGMTITAAIAFVTPSNVKSFIVVPDILAASWVGQLAFVVP